MSLLNPFGLFQQKPPSPIYCEREPSPSPPCPRFTPSWGPAMQISFSPRASVLYGAVSPLSLGASSSLTRSTTLSAYRSFSLLPRVLSLLRRYHPFVRSLSLFLSRSRFLALSLSHQRPSRSTTLFVFLISTARTPTPVPFHSATPPTPPPSRPIQSPPRHPSFTASLAAYRLSFCHCGLFDILSTAVRTEARLSRGRREILETNDGERKKSRTREPILVPASRRF